MQQIYFYFFFLTENHLLTKILLNKLNLIFPMLFWKVSAWDKPVSITQTQFDKQTRAHTVHKPNPNATIIYRRVRIAFVLHPWVYTMHTSGDWFRSFYLFFYSSSCIARVPCQVQLHLSVHITCIYLYIIQMERKMRRRLRFLILSHRVLIYLHVRSTWPSYRYIMYVPIRALESINYCII